MLCCLLAAVFTACAEEQKTVNSCWFGVHVVFQSVSSRSSGRHSHHRGRTHELRGGNRSLWAPGAAGLRQPEREAPAAAGRSLRLRSEPGQRPAAAAARIRRRELLRNQGEGQQQTCCLLPWRHPGQILPDRFSLLPAARGPPGALLSCTAEGGWAQKINKTMLQKLS